MSIIKSTIPTRPCRGCGKEVGFAKDDQGKWQVLDMTPPVYVQIRDTDKGERQVMRVTGFVSHYATCPNASEFSKKAKKEEQSHADSPANAS